jgi:tetratricopeptide (TPR) repeat protein
MPPWPPERGFGDFAGDRSLTQTQIELFSEWIKQGKPEGDPASLPSAPTFTGGWQLGEPDLILKMPRPFRMPESGSDVFRNFILPSGVTQVKYVRALELRVDNPRAVHHANIVLDRIQALRRRDGEDGQPGFPGMDVITEAAANNFDPDSHFLFWKPATVLRPEADDMSWRLDPATDLVLNLHLQPTGKEEMIQVQVGIYFAAHAPAKFPMLLQLEHDGAIRIPPGDRTFSVTDSLTLPVDVDLLAIYPHAHYLGKTVEAWAILPNGNRRWLIRITDWDINWQATYDYREPIALPKGTRVAMRITYDNSTANPRNPNRPPKLVLTGNRSEDEMGHVWLQVLPKGNSGSGDPRLLLQEAAMRRRLEKYPGDFLAHYNLAALLAYGGHLDSAITEYSAALRSEPDSAGAHNALGVAFMAEGKLAEANAQLRDALRLDATYANAHYNLARVLAASADTSGAATEYETFLKTNPNDADAQAGLGTMQFKEHRFADALIHFREAARLNPQDPDIQTNLGTLLAITGDLPAAAEAFQIALRLNPGQAAARANLDRVRTQMQARK